MKRSRMFSCASVTLLDLKDSLDSKLSFKSNSFYQLEVFTILTLREYIKTNVKVLRIKTTTIVRSIQM